MAEKYFFDLPVYRISRENYSNARDEHIATSLLQIGTSRSSEVFMDCLQRTYGGCWDFNEVIGYIRLHFLGNQVRGEYFSVARKRIVKTRTKILEFQTWKLAPEIEIEPPYISGNVLFAIEKYIYNCKKKIPRRHIETSLFDQISKYVDWEMLFREGSR
jgi:hypothetical protein